jgi:hypothetical protein
MGFKMRNCAAGFDGRWQQRQGRFKQYHWNTNDNGALIPDEDNTQFLYRIISYRQRVHKK